MIITELYNGQGLGNQLWCYVVTRVIARKRGFDFGIKSPEKFKGASFMNLDFGKTVIGGSGPEGGLPFTLPEGITNYYKEIEIKHPKTGADIRLYDPNLMNIPDGTKIDGLMQDEQYIVEYKTEIREWLKIKGLDVSEFTGDDICILNLRGGEYTRHSELYLPRKYWLDAMANMRKANANLKFLVITDDIEAANKLLPEIKAFHFDIAKDYTILSKAKYLMLSNSSFAWFPAWLSTDLKHCIAPKYWARHNVSDGYWSLGYNITSGWAYQDRDGQISTSEECQKEFNSYIQSHPAYFEGHDRSADFRFVPNTPFKHFYKKLAFYAKKVLEKMFV